MLFRRPRLARDRHGDKERAASTRCTLHGDATTLRLHESFHDRQPQSGAARLIAAAPPEPLEDVRQIVGGDAFPGVAHPELHLTAMVRGTHHDAAAGRRELRRIADQILEDLQHAIAVAPRVRELVARVRAQIQGQVRGELAVRLDRVRDDRGRRHRRGIHREGACVELRHIQQILNQPVHPPRGALDRLTALVGGMPALLRVAQRRRLHEDAAEGIAQVVRDDAHDFVTCRDRAVGGGVQARVIDGEREALADILDEARVALVVAPPGVRGYERDDAEKQSADLQGNRDQRRRCEVVHETTVLVAPCQRVEEFGGHMRDDGRAPRRDRRRREVWREPVAPDLLEGLREATLPRIAMDDARPPRRRFGVPHGRLGDVHHARIGELPDEQLRRVLHQLLALER